jgi:hypothetical protein
MDRIKKWSVELGFVGVMAGALLARDACIGGGRRPPPEPAVTASPATASPPVSAAPPAQPAPTGTFATPP